jgi:SAM-dependent methyltransferase
MAATDPTTTHRLFQHERVATGYASARPYLHPEVFARVRELIRPEGRFTRALDVGCGTGLSSVALTDLAEEVVGVDVSMDMLRRARRAAGVRYIAASAEDLPLGDGSFDVILACGSMDWVDRPRFLPRAADLLVAGGWLVSLDFGDAGRSPEAPGLAPWYRDVFQDAYPRPPARDPIITPGEASAHLFDVPTLVSFASDWVFNAKDYAAFLMTESNVVAAVEYGHQDADCVRRWLEAELEPIFDGDSRRVAFEGYIQVLRRLRGRD